MGGSPAHVLTSVASPEVCLGGLSVALTVLMVVRHLQPAEKEQGEKEE